MPKSTPHNAGGLSTFFSPQCCELLRKQPLGEYLDEFVKERFAAGYCSLTIERSIGPALHLGVWLRRRGVKLAMVDSDLLKRFRQHLRWCRCRRQTARMPGRRSSGRGHRCCRREVVMVEVLHFVEHLRRRGLIPPVPAPPSLPLVAEFDLWMRQHRGSAERTLADYRPLAAAFVESRRGRRWDHLDAKAIRSYVIDECKKLTPARRLVFVRALRMFMRFLVSTGRCRSHLDRSVPQMPHWKLATLPRYVDEDVIERLIESRSKKTLTGLRDRAVLLLLARLALRAGDVRGLCLSDIDWARGRLRVVGKLRRPTWLPMPQDVGDAILAYLRVRQKCQLEQVFLCIQAPHRSLHGTSVRSICQRAIDELGVKTPSKGAHLFRHSAAVTLIRHGATLDDVGRLLRHASRESTAVYAKVAIDALRRVAQPWPGAVR
jgi:integrase/recombinase XerD